MKNQSVVQHLLGFNAVFDRISRINIRLPEKYRIYIRSEKVWIGGKEDGTSYLLMERIPAKALELSKPLADGDLDIKVFPKGQGSEMAEGIVSQKIDCKLRGEKLTGLWLRVAFSPQFHYLILLAGESPEMYPELESAGQEIARTIRSQIPDFVPVRQQQRSIIEV
jgi:hypothetical protein